MEAVTIGTFWKLWAEKQARGMWNTYNPGQPIPEVESIELCLEDPRFGFIVTYKGGRRFNVILIGTVSLLPDEVGTTRGRRA